MAGFDFLGSGPSACGDQATSRSHPAHEFIRTIRTQDVRRPTPYRSGLRRGGSLTGARIEAEVSLLIAVADGLEIQWLLDPSVDLHRRFKRNLDQTIQPWRAGWPVQAPQA
jgi:hypothetical protein